MTDENLIGRISTNLAAVRSQIADACLRTGRAVESVKLVTVTKAQPVEVIEAALQAGAEWLGENYPEETLPKIMRIGDQRPVAWHMIGHLQSRKAKIVAQYFDMLESLDSVNLALQMDRLAAENARKLPVLLEINVSGEASKGGFNGWEENHWEELAKELAPVMQLTNLDVRGLMTMPPYEQDPEKVRPFFRRLALLRNFLSEAFSRSSLTHLSMGTSVDYKTAIEEGATIVRIGTAIVGPRPKKLV